MDKLELLGRNFLFRDLDRSALERLAALAVTRRLKKGEVLFNKGDEGDALYGVRSGNICISTTAPNGKEIILSVMERGDVFGEIALLDGLPRTADAWALEGSELIMMRRRDFTSLLEREPSLAVHLLELLCERLRSTNAMLEDVSFLGLPARLAKRLLSLATIYGQACEDGEMIGLKLSQSDLGQMLGTSRESINKQLQEWVRQGFVKLGRSRVTICDRPALQQVVEKALTA